MTTIKKIDETRIKNRVRFIGRSGRIYQAAGEVFTDVDGKNYVAVCQVCDGKGFGRM